MTVPIAVISQI